MAIADGASGQEPAHQGSYENPDLSGDESQDDGYTVSADGASTHPTSLSTASRKFPSDLKTIQCPHPGCSKTFNRPARLTAHLRSHAGERPFKCAQCDKSYIEEKHLRQHVKGSHTEERTYTCQHPGCGKSFLTGSRLRRHAAVHEGAERFRCREYDGCDKSFRKHTTLQRHIRTEHLGQKAFLCANKGCVSEFDSSGALRRHMEREHGDIKYWCDECGDDREGNANGDGPQQATAGTVVGFTTMALLEAHIRLEHILCIFCEIRCKSQTELDHHLEQAHMTNPPPDAKTVEERKTIACTWDGCPKKFTRRSNLSVHIRTAHQGVRFECGQVDLTKSADIEGWDGADACGKAFHSKMRLEEHVRVYHLHLKRPVAQVSTAAPEPTQLVDILSGVAQERVAVISCTVVGCAATFQRYADLHTHAQEHLSVAPEPAEDTILMEPPALEDNEVLGLLAEYNARNEHELAVLGSCAPQEEVHEWAYPPDTGMEHPQHQSGTGYLEDLAPYLDPSLLSM